MKHRTRGQQLRQRIWGNCQISTRQNIIDRFSHKHKRICHYCSGIATSLSILTVYRSPIESQLCYNFNTVWCNCKDTLLQKLQGHHNRSVAVVCEKATAILGLVSVKQLKNYEALSQCIRPDFHSMHFARR